MRRSKALFGASLIPIFCSVATLGIFNNNANAISVEMAFANFKDQVENCSAETITIGAPDGEASLEVKFQQDLELHCNIRVGNNVRLDLNGFRLSSYGNAKYAVTFLDTGDVFTFAEGGKIEDLDFKLEDNSILRLLGGSYDNVDFYSGYDYVDTHVEDNSSMLVVNGGLYTNSTFHVSTNSNLTVNAGSFRSYATRSESSNIVLESGVNKNDGDGEALVRINAGYFYAHDDAGGAASIKMKTYNSAPNATMNLDVRYADFEGDNAIITDIADGHEGDVITLAGGLNNVGGNFIKPYRSATSPLVNITDGEYITQNSFFAGASAEPNSSALSANLITGGIFSDSEIDGLAENYTKVSLTGVDSDNDGVEDVMVSRGIDVSEELVELDSGETYDITLVDTENNALAEDEYSRIVWEISDTDIVTGDGKTLTAKESGSAIATAVFGSQRKTYWVVVDGVETFADLKDSIDGFEMEIGDTKTMRRISSTNSSVDDRIIREKATWASDNTSVATVEKGVITAVSAGSAQITVAYKGIETTFTVEVNPEEVIEVAEIVESYSLSSQDVGTIKTLTGISKSGTDADDAAIRENATWSSSNEDVVTVAQGVLTYLAAGNATITVIYNGATLSFNVVSVGEDIVVLPVLVDAFEGVELDKDEEYTLTGLASSGESADDETIRSDGVWVSTNEAVATVDNGVVTAISTGFANITVNYEGKSLTIMVSVIDDSSESPDPDDPSNPSQPSDPSDPSDPNNPSNPTDSNNPSNPNNPSQPSNPSDPSNPSNPSSPSNPSDPQNPGEIPSGDDEPDDPGNGDNGSGDESGDKPSGGNSDKDEEEKKPSGEIVEGDDGSDGSDEEKKTGGAKDEENTPITLDKIGLPVSVLCGSIVTIFGLILFTKTRRK